MSLAFSAVAAAVAIALLGEPGPVELAEFKEAKLTETLIGRHRHLDPAEVLSLMRNKQVRLHLIDVRDERDFNLFHLVDAIRVPISDLEAGTAQTKFHPLALKIVMSNDEARAEAAWRLIEATGVRGAYILEGGINLWLEVFRHRRSDAASQLGQDDLRHKFTAALGSGYSYARPEVDAAHGRTFSEKATLLTTVAKLAGGCGG